MSKFAQQFWPQFTLSTILTGAFLSGTALAAPSDAEVAKGAVLNLHILVDQFGYRPGDAKVAVIRDPQAGFDKSDRFSPGSTYQLRKVDSGEVVFTGSPKPWKSSATEASSGDRGWWFDFSSINTPGQYFVYDTSRNARSANFKIDEHVYKGVLQAAMRMYFYQRSGFKKAAPHAEACWADNASYDGKNQDREAIDVNDRNNRSKVRDVSGGWFDAGDTSKYVTYATQPVNQLLSAFTNHKAAFGDDFNIPESSNGVPDVLDEVKWETDWLKRMQYPDGTFALKVGEIVYNYASPPSTDRTARFYIPSCTSATISAASMLAHAAIVFKDFPSLAEESEDLGRRARIAWKAYASAPAKQTSCDANIVHAGNADLNSEDQDQVAAEAAVYLFALTEDPMYEGFLKQHYKDTKPFHDIGWSRYKPDQGEALLYYTTLKSADKDLKQAIIDAKLNDVRMGNQVYGFAPNDDLYRAFMHDGQYHWGSNNPRANYGNTNLDVIRYGLSTKDQDSLKERALGILHYFHGVNPFGMVYLTNMYQYGATNSANEIFHNWFIRSSKWSNAKTSPCGPPPGYVPGGPNANAAKDGVPASLMPPTGQPPQKSYKDWNVGDQEKSWAITEPAIYYQSAYVELLSAFVE